MHSLSQKRILITYQAGRVSPYIGGASHSPREIPPCTVTAEHHRMDGRGPLPSSICSPCVVGDAFACVTGETKAATSIKLLCHSHAYLIFSLLSFFPSTIAVGLLFDETRDKTRDEPSTT